MQPLTDTNTKPLSETRLASGQEIVKHRQGSLEFEQMDLVYRQSFLSFSGALIALITLLYILSFHIETKDLMVLGVSLIVMYLVRTSLSIAYNRQPVELRQKNLNFWKNRFLLMTFLTGLIWGVGATVLMPASIQTQVFVTLVIGGLSAAATVSYSAMKCAGLTFILPAFLPVSIFYFRQPHESSLSFGVLCLLYIVLMSVASNKMYKVTRRSLKYANDNKQLISELQHTNRIVVQLNQDLHNENIERRQAEERFKRLSDASGEGVLLHNQGIIVDANQRLVDMLGYNVDELIGTKAISHIEEESRNVVEDKLLNTDDLTVQVYAQRKNGSVFPVEIRGKDVPFGEVILRVVLVQDLSKRLEVESALNMEKERAMVTLESIGDGVVTTDRNGTINYINPVAEELSGWLRHEAVGNHLADILRLKDQNSDEVITDPVANCLTSENKIILSGEILLQGTRSLQQFSIEVTISPIRDAKEKIIGTVLVFHDVTVLHTMARQMSHQATHDALTGLINRQEFEHRLSGLLESARRNEVQHAMCYLDLDEFKVVNDTSGHAAGDQLLQEISARLEDCIRDSDTLARLGGDEFGVLLTSCPIDKAREISEALRKAVKEYRLAWENHVYEVGVSIGLVPLDSESGEITDVLRAADSACYVAKDRGRNRVHVYEKDDAELARHHGNMRWMQKIQRALENDHFLLYYQPIKDANFLENQFWHSEILLRMTDGKGSIISPEMFMPAAERYHLMVDVDRWVVKNSLQKLFHTAEFISSSEFLCAINLSGQSLSDDDFLTFLVSEIERSGIKAQNLCFEITETAAIANFEYAQRFITVIKSMGCKFALDDFGSGLSSFGYLKRLPVDFLKIDGSFVQNICEDSTDFAMVKSIQQIGNVMGIKTIAEFVDSPQIIKQLQELGVDYLQGYGVGEPALLDAIISKPIKAVQK